MTFTKEIVSNAIYVDFSEEILFDNGEVNICLHDTNELVAIADHIRKEEGYIPMFDYSGEYDNDGWYNFYITIDNSTNHIANSAIMFTVSSETQDDDGREYYIDLSEKEQHTIYEEIDKQCRKVLNESCEELLKESNKEEK